MKVVHSIADVRQEVASARQQGRKIGCVPTMGALHAGHISLVDQCRQLVDYCVVTIFVNPTQFSANEDLSKYPRPIEADLEACRNAGVDCVYLPEIASLYPENYQSWVTVEELSKTLEGEFRPTHFRGVTTIVAKLFNIVLPEIACFGAKDYQQHTLIRRMAQDLNIPTEIVVCPTIREADGLAMSSRNVYLSAEERRDALAISRALRNAETRLKNGEPVGETERIMQSELQIAQGVETQYAVIRDPDTLKPVTTPGKSVVALIAAIVGKTRLIDNLTIHLK
ncbi:pantoate--beta-alanine ligase [Planctomicrobium sp. SH668]|uniref:pantoate--beta-alanine ligase n=1 Tax=Planctomicrobium sp. SH668 TaxID=3448126 RepID=UPI003F5CA046